MPDDLLEEVFARLPADRIPAVAGVCKRWNFLIHDRRASIPFVKLAKPMTFLYKNGRLSAITASASGTNANFVTAITKRLEHKTADVKMI